MSNKTDENFNVNDLITDVFDKTRIKISESDPLFLAVVLNQKILDITLKKLADSNSIISEKFYTDIQNELVSIKTEINDLPNAIDTKTSKLRQAAIALHDEFQQSKGEVKGAFEEARINATTQLSEAIAGTSSAAKEVISTAEKAVSDVNTATLTAIEKIDNSAEVALNNRVKNTNEAVNITSKKINIAITNAWRQASNKTIWLILAILFVSTALQMGMWGWFVWRLMR